MGNILDQLGVSYEIGIDEAAFYGPKLDIQYKNVFGKEDTLVTIQIDMLLAKRFGMYYTDTDGQKKLPYIIHRTSLGCYERTLAYMLEHFAGALPLWLAPEQVKIIPIADRHLDFANAVQKQLTAAGLRCQVDSRADKVCYDSAPFIFNLSPVIKDKARGVIWSISEIRSEIHRSRKREENYAEEH